VRCKAEQGQKAPSAVASSFISSAYITDQFVGSAAILHAFLVIKKRIHCFPYCVFISFPPRAELTPVSGEILLKFQNYIY